MANRFANGARAFGFCDVCGFRFDLKKLKNLVVKTKQTQIKACPQCWTPDHPQLQLGMYPVADPQAIRDPRPDTNTWYQSGTNGLQTSPTSGTNPDQEGYPGEGMLVIQWGWNPIGGSQSFDAALTPNTLVGVGEVGQIADFVNGPPVPGGDPYFAGVKLLLHMDGTAGSTTFVDNSPVNYTISPFSGAQIDTSVVKFGTGSFYATAGRYLRVDALSGTYLSIASGTPWTLELWFYSATFNSIRWNSAGATRFSLGARSSASTVSAYLVAPITASNLTTTDYPIPVSNWNFIAVVNDPSTSSMSLYINGVLTATQTLKPLTQIGYIGFTAGNPALEGYIDEVRITAGVARYTSNFTPPTSAFPNY